MKISVIIPTYNEEKVIKNCLRSLGSQTVASKMEVIVVDDGSRDTTVSQIRNSIRQLADETSNLLLLEQNHCGPGVARNLGASTANGDILVFVDADMEFEKDFIEKLTEPIIENKAAGTFSREEFLLNKESAIARCWNLNLGRKADHMEPRDYDTQKLPIYNYLKNVWLRIEGGGGNKENKGDIDKSHVFRAILKSEFERAGGFNPKAGYTDDWSLSEKLGIMAKASPGAKYYHRNPDSLKEIWVQARWFGKNKFLTGNLVRKLYNLFRYNPFFAIVKGILGVAKFGFLEFLVFKVVYDTAVFTSIVFSFFGERKSK